MLEIGTVVSSFETYFIWIKTNFVKFIMDSIWYHTFNTFINYLWTIWNKEYVKGLNFVITKSYILHDITTLVAIFFFILTRLNWKNSTIDFWL